jgi:3-methyladenine DNA glycosylase AlkD
MNIIESSVDDDEFFMQNDLGWALRGFAEPLIQKRSIEDSDKQLRDMVYTWICLMKPEQNL